MWSVLKDTPTGIFFSRVNNVSEHVIERGIIPAYMISQSTGTLGFDEVLPRVCLFKLFGMKKYYEIHGLIDK